MKNKQVGWALLIGGLIGGMAYHYRVDREESHVKTLLNQAVFLAEKDRSRVVGVQLTANGQWKVLPFADAGAAFSWLSTEVVTPGGFAAPGTFSVWFDKAKDNWRETAFANAVYGKGVRR